MNLRHIKELSTETKDLIQGYAEITEDVEMLDALKSEAAVADEADDIDSQRLLESILDETKGEPDVEKVLKML